MPHQTSFACPHCEATVQTGASACQRCGIRLTGRDAQRLWEVDQQIASLVAERGRLIDTLTGPSDAPSNAALPAGDRAAVATSAPPSVDARTATPRKALSGQQLLLGLGALLLLSAASFFLLVVWLVVGLVGQALIMATLTGTAVVGSRWATRRGLAAVAETAAVLATGLLLIDLSAAHALGLAGLDAVPSSHYWTGATLLGAALLLGWDRLIPRQGQGRPLRRVLTYRPAAAAMVAATPWFLLAAAAPATMWVPAALLLVALSNLCCAALAVRLDSPVASPAPKEGALGSRMPASAIVLFIAATLSLTGYAVSGLLLGYDLDRAEEKRYAAFAALMAAPLVLAWVGRHLSGRAISDRLTSALPAVAVLWAAAALGIPLLDATYSVLVALSVIAAVVATGVHLRRPTPGTPLAAAWMRASAAFVFVAQPVLLLCALWLTLANHQHESLHAAMTSDPFTVGGLVAPPEPSRFWTVLAAAAWAMSAAVGAAHRRSGGWAFVAHTATMVALLTALEDTSARTAWVVLLGAFTAAIGLTCLASRRSALIAAIQSRIQSGPSDRIGDTGITAVTAPRLMGSPFWSGVERASAAFAALYALAAIAAAAAVSSGHVSASFIFVGVLTLVYAASPGRLPVAYLGSLTISAGIANLMSEASVTIIEAYTAPLVALLATIGYVQWTRNPHAATRLTMGPALAVAFGPSLLTSLDEGDELRLVVVTAAAVAALLVGLTRRWKAPVTTGALALTVVALTQGGPLTEYVPGWLTLGAAGAALLAAGVAWEKAVLAGRRAQTWYGALV